MQTPYSTAEYCMVQYMLRFAYLVRLQDDFTLQKGPWGPLLPVCDRHSFYLIFFTDSTGRYRSTVCIVKGMRMY